MGSQPNGKDQAWPRELDLPFFEPDEQSESAEFPKNRVNLRRMAGGLMEIPRENHGPGSFTRLSIATARQKAAASAKTIAQSDDRGEKIGPAAKGELFRALINQRTQEAAQKSTEENKSAVPKFKSAAPILGIILRHFIKDMEKASPQKTTDHQNQTEIESVSSAEVMGFCAAVGIQNKKAIEEREVEQIGWYDD